MQEAKRNVGLKLAVSLANINGHDMVGMTIVEPHKYKLVKELQPSTNDYSTENL